MCTISSFRTALPESQDITTQGYYVILSMLPHWVTIALQKNFAHDSFYSPA